MKLNKAEQYKATLIKLRTYVNTNKNHLHDVTQQKGASNCLTTHPIIDQGYDLKKQ